ncbi:C6 transcription factor protein [Rutstroemia sp. NJR-2017a WRK4]|nr:C6 transcription factor protein [Rutstroemia sp. NJR-2017a WRK4]
MPSRRSHIKSHHGCSQCKLRRVKCDEKQPVCSRCHAYKRECTYNSVISPPPGQHSFELRPPVKPSKPINIRPSKRDPPPRSSSDTIPPLPFGIHKETDALLHHYVNVTSKPITSAFNRYDQNKWELAVKKNATTHEYVYNGMLSFAALHLAVLQPDKRAQHVSTALKFQNQGMLQFRPTLENITAANCEAALGFSGLLISSVYAFPLAQAGPDKPSEKLLDYLPIIFSLFNGTVAIYRMGWMKQLNSDLAKHLRLKVVAADAHDAPRADGEDFLEALEQTEIAGLRDRRARSLYNDVSFKVRRNLRRTAMFPGRAWPGAAAPPFIECVKRREPIALVLVAYWAVGQDRGVGYNWWARDWGRNIVDTIAKQLGEDWSYYMVWPKQQVGLL